MRRERYDMSNSHVVVSLKARIDVCTFDTLSNWQRSFDFSNIQRHSAQKKFPNALRKSLYLLNAGHVCYDLCTKLKNSILALQETFNTDWSVNKQQVIIT